MDTHRKTRLRSLWLLAVVVIVLAALAHEAAAIIGRPLTPLSYAGVARRTTRRAVVYGAAARPMYW